MRIQLESGTDVACHALFDPAALAGAPAVDDDGEALSSDGRLLSLYTASDGGFEALAFLDEDVPADWRRRAKAVAERLLLKVPSGRLVMAGLEFVDEPETLAKAAPYALERSAGLTSGNVPAGNYEVDVLLLDWDDEREVAPALKRRLGVQYSFERALGPLSGLLFFLGLAGTLFALVAAVVSLIKGRWPSPWLLAGPLAVVVGFSVAKALERPAWHARRRAAQNEFPDVLLVLRRLPADADLSGRRGGVARLADALDSGT